MMTTNNLQSQVLLSRDGYIEFYFPYSVVEKDYVKALGTQYVPAGKYWRIKVANLPIGRLRAYATRFGAHVAPEVELALGVRERDDGASRELSKAHDADISDIDLSGFGITLFPFQRAGVKYALNKKRAIIGDDPGLGKTNQALAVFHASRVHRLIVVCPASVKIHWQRETARALPYLKTSLWGSKAGDSNVDVIIINYDNLRKHVNALREFRAGVIVFDETHYLKTPTAKRTIAANALSRGVAYVLGLTGTPILNRPDELTTPLQMLGYLDSFGGWLSFVTRYCQAYQRKIWVKGKKGTFRKTIWDTSGASNLTELNDRLRALCMIRRRKIDVLTELPPKLRAQVVFEIDNRDEYQDAEDNLLEYIKACAAEDKAFLATIKGLPEAERKAKIEEYQNEATKSAERAEQLVFINTTKQIAVRGMLASAIEWIADFLESDQKLVVFAIHRVAQDALLEAFPKAARIIAHDDINKRQANVDRFRTDSHCRLLIASLGAGGTGIDGLQDVCSNVAFMELGWTPAEHIQAEDRCYRIGQNNRMTAYYFVAENTIMESIQTTLAEKQAVCDSVLDGAPEVSGGSVFNALLDELSIKADLPKKKRRKRRAPKFSLTG